MKHIFVSASSCHLGHSGITKTENKYNSSPCKLCQARAAGIYDLWCQEIRYPLGYTQKSLCIRDVSCNTVYCIAVPLQDYQNSQLKSDKLRFLVWPESFVPSFPDNSYKQIKAFQSRNKLVGAPWWPNRGYSACHITATSLVRFRLGTFVCWVSHPLSVFPCFLSAFQKLTVNKGKMPKKYYLKIFFVKVRTSE